MAGNRQGGLKAAKTNKDLYGKDWYRQIGKMGGEADYNGKKGFAADRQRARIAGEKGGRTNRRRKTDG